MGRLVIVSNRLPATLQVEHRRARFEPSVGGLATGLLPFHDASDSVWIGWPGDMDKVRVGQRAELDAWLAARRLKPLALKVDEVSRYYEGYANEVLWPLFHYQPGRLPLQIDSWDAYEAVNRRFADAVAAELQDGDTVWVHDYQLMRVPALLRRRVPDAKIGFFLHIPFPTPELFRILPQRDAILEGLLGADLVGFHTASYQHHFSSAVLRGLGATTDVDRIRWDDREVRLGVYPMGVDTAEFATLQASDDVRSLVDSFRGARGTTVVGVDRLDYTKGILRRLLAFRRLLERHPELHEHVRLIQIAVPSRERVTEYRSFRRLADELVGQINGKFGTAGWTPIHWIARALPRADVAALYRAADVMVVTPLRDGMNLVAKEFVASRVDGDGVLVLSEFAGAAAELAEAIHVNPYDVESAADALVTALRMPEAERRARMLGMRSRVLEFPIGGWARGFLRDLDMAALSRGGVEPSPAGVPDEVLARIDAAPRLVLLLDYDGTLVPIARAPALAAPPSHLLELLNDLAAADGIAVHVVSGRTPDTLQRWLGELPVTLHAEHGAWCRAPGGEWRQRRLPEMAWREPVARLLRQFAHTTPGSLVEEKAAGVAWHYRWADPELAARRERDLVAELSTLLANSGAEVLRGRKVIEVRPFGVTKALVVPDAIHADNHDSVVVALGDDSTDDELFAALPSDAVSIGVGRGTVRARFVLRSVAQARAFLERLRDLRRSPAHDLEPALP